ncbi:SIR2 family protein [Variovorax sp. LjRoot175]|uniref:SIR2 family protein n=1 Tax=Variovorax sp. LjRoot175 TaxID=3342276 RepID=UPI003ECF96FF
MKKLLLLGAGFSRNWGGWLASEAFEYLLGCPEIVDNREVTHLLWKSRDAGGFEEVLAEIRRAWMRDNRKEQPNLEAIQAAIGRMFDDMNAGFFSLDRFEFQLAQPRMVSSALARFDAIFTLNQDLLLEHHYLPEGAASFSGNRWSGGCTPPGVRPTPSQARVHLSSFAKYDCVPDPAIFQVDSQTQPYFKLHGSSNWTERNGGPLMIMGANKVEDMKLFPLLMWYQQEFERYLMQEPESRLMVIGYSFRDAHINETIFRSVRESGLKLFIVDPAGADIAWQVNPTRKPFAIGASPSELEGIFQAAVIGASRRPLSQIFGSDQVEHAKVMRFIA